MARESESRNCDNCTTMRNAHKHQSRAQIDVPLTDIPTCGWLQRRGRELLLEAAVARHFVRAAPGGPRHGHDVQLRGEAHDGAGLGEGEGDAAHLGRRGQGSAWGRGRRQVCVDGTPTTDAFSDPRVRLFTPTWGGGGLIPQGVCPYLLPPSRETVT